MWKCAKKNWNLLLNFLSQSTSKCSSYNNKYSMSFFRTKHCSNNRNFQIYRLETRFHTFYVCYIFECFLSMVSFLGRCDPNCMPNRNETLTIPKAAFITNHYIYLFHRSLAVSFWMAEWKCLLSAAPKLYLSQCCLDHRSLCTFNGKLSHPVRKIFVVL